MISNNILKICKIDSLEFASFAIKQNADFLGIHVLDMDTIGDHLELVLEINKAGGKSVIVTKISDHTSLFALVQLYNPYGIQLHYEPKPETAIYIKKEFPNLKVFAVLTNETTNPNLPEIDSSFDFLIYDTTYGGGTGMANDYHHLEMFSKTLLGKTLLAGGITAEKIPELLGKNCCGFDIQSYFRDKYGLNFGRLENIADHLKFPRVKKISVSLTDLSLTRVPHTSNYAFFPQLEYHLDYSEGKLYSSFNTIRNSFDEKSNLLQTLPHSLHFFLNTKSEIERKINKIISKNHNALTRIFVQFHPGLQMEALNLDSSDIKILLSVYYKDLNQFMLDFPECPKFLSIIVPSTDKPSNVETFIQLYKSHQKYFEFCELWLDRNLDLSYIKYLNEALGKNFNYIIGKEVISDCSKINEIHEYLLK